MLPLNRTRIPWHYADVLPRTQHRNVHPSILMDPLQTQAERPISFAVAAGANNGGGLYSATLKSGSGRSSA